MSTAGASPSGTKRAGFSLRSAERKGPERLRFFGQFGELCCGSQHHGEVVRWLQFLRPLAAAGALAHEQVSSGA